MLVLARRRGESFWIGDSILVTVLSVGKSVIRLGIEAPQSVQVMRGELILLEDSKANRETTGVWEAEPIFEGADDKC